MKHKQPIRIKRAGHGDEPRTAVGRIEQMKERMQKKQCPFCGRGPRGRRRVVVKSFGTFITKNRGIVNIWQKKIWRVFTMVRCDWCQTKHILPFGPKTKPVTQLAAFYRGTVEEPGSISGD